MKEIFIVFQINTWNEPASWDVYKIFEDEKSAEAFYYKDWPKNSGRYRIQSYKVEQ